MVQQQRELIEIVVALQAIELKPRISEVVRDIVILVPHAGEIWGKPVLLRVGPARTLKIREGALM